ncbi:2Fe-2S iron-sulfur cluster-binding protein [Sphingobium lactosutens]|uniref:(2Fe-2S)-binding protein n=1 Tax=Sphingobium lactosutens DS20 TaxID=1331060 RepID=T0HIS5_9SPHN|nr:2Fe-2S iron-sulfur cluster-binding protein [Sphingobium lactosutens]EQB12917.1 (2Fe-2S)-binding protein [Sphingobium lactosutens DS20]
MAIWVNGSEVPVPDDARVSLLDLLREHLHLTGTKKGCDQGACGACTVLLDDNRILSCLMLAAQADGRKVLTIEGITGDAGNLHRLQQAFVEHDGLQCGYCTPGQICSAIGMVDELRRGDPSYVTLDVTAPPVPTRAEIRERMSGNLCRCGAHNGIVEAIEDMLAETAA